MNAATSPAGRAPIKVLLADDEGLVRSGFKVLLHLEDDITVVGRSRHRRRRPLRTVPHPMEATYVV